MTIPTTPLNFPIQAKPIDEQGNWTPAWLQSLQRLYDRVGSAVAPSNAQLAAAISNGVQGSGATVDGDITLFSGVTGTLIKDSGVQLSALATTAQLAAKAPSNAPTFTGISTFSGPLLAANVTFSGLLQTAASAAAGATVNVAPGAAPTTPTNGDFWSTTAGFFGRANGVTFGPFGAAAWGSITGTLSSQTDLQTALNLLAPLASPALTGTASAVNVTFSGLALTAASATGGAGIRIPHGTAPTTPVNGDFWSTASGFFGRVAGATVGPFGVTAAGATSSFSAHNNAVAQSIPTATSTKLTFSTAVYNFGSNFTTSTWTPPTGKLVSITGAVAIAATAGAQILVMVYKNGTEYKRGVMTLPQGAGTFVLTVSCQDAPSGTDTYELWIYQATGSSQNTNGLAVLTYFQGTTITP